MPGDPRIRASDADRDRVAALLREHHADGRLTAEEFNERLDKALAARTIGELDALLEDLPSIDLYRLPDASLRRPPPGSTLPWPGSGLAPMHAARWAAWAGVSSLLFIVWLVTAIATGGGAWFPWFIFVSGLWGYALARRRR
ncbi:MAG: DUF1707 domain-containing protein [Streptosporangiaceae bacterium]|nr:DUF1707 domain-containing protein [Streptosporangiaceae bacterium]